jgi:hypothetical protein
MRVQDQQTELVLMIFRSLAEDLHVFDVDDLPTVWPATSVRARCMLAVKLTHASHRPSPGICTTT